MKIMSVVGARPNFMKVAPIISVLKRLEAACPENAPVSVLVHTGQHYDAALSEKFFSDLELPAPDVFLGVGSGSHAAQTAEIMKKFEAVVLSEKPDLILVIGDVNSTLASALVASKLTFAGCRPKIAHVEAGLRSFDMTMPEEINRILTDHVSDMLFVTEQSAMENLRREGIPDHRMHFSGNTMIDTLLRFKDKAAESKILESIGLKKGSKPGPYGLLTLHRPANVDCKEVFSNIIDGLREVSREMPVIFPVHPRTRNKIEDFGLASNFISRTEAGGCVNGLITVEPLGYIDFLCLMMNSRIVLTDSGGIQEETTCLGVPCVTIRANTERPITVSEGTNVLAGMTSAGIAEAAARQLKANMTPKTPEKWDGMAAQRIVEVLTGFNTAEVIS